MAQLDRLKEEIGHEKLWEGAAIAVFAGLIGWIVSNAETSKPETFWLAVAGVVLTGITIVRLGRQIGERIERIGKL